MYRIVLKKSAKKFLDKLPPNERGRIVREIEKTSEGRGYKAVKRTRRTDAAADRKIPCHIYR